MIKKPDIHPLAEKHLRELRGRWGIILTDAEVLWIVQLCERVICPGGGGDLEYIGMPERVGHSDVFLWRLTIGAAIWLEECAFRWWSDSNQLIRANAFALAHARRGDVFRDLYIRETAERVIKQWFRGLGCTHEELDEAISRLYPPQETLGGDRDGKAIDNHAWSWGAIIDDLEATTGIQADHWLWDQAVGVTLRRLALAKQVAAAGVGGDVDKDTDKALFNLAQAKKSIIDLRGAK